MCMLCVFISYYYVLLCFFFFFKQKTAYEMRISDWSSDVCSSDLSRRFLADRARHLSREEAPRGGLAPDHAADQIGSAQIGQTGGAGMTARPELRALTSVRGLAAWMVVLYHIRLSIAGLPEAWVDVDRKSTRLNSSH